MVYLLHFTMRLHHAQHYLGSCKDGRLEERLAEHKSGHGARLPQVFAQLGVEFQCVRTWPGDRKKEQTLKRQKNGRRLCPFCRKERKK